MGKLWGIDSSFDNRNGYCSSIGHSLPEYSKQREELDPPFGQVDKQVLPDFTKVLNT